MNRMIQLKQTTLTFLIALVTVCLGLSQTAQAVIPPPPGGYPNFTTATGHHALQALTLGTGNTAIGTFSLFSVTTGNFNTAVGAGSLDLNTADSNTATGAAALLFNTTGTENTANGTAAVEFNDTGSNNTADGAFALFSNTIGNLNTAVGNGTLFGNISGTGNTAVGAGAGNLVTTANNVICIGAAGNNVDNSCYIGNIFNATSSNGVAVLINSNGKLGTMTSSRRFKDEIKPMGKASEPLFALKPVSFRYKKEIDPEGTSAMQFGLVAEDVEKVNPDLIVRDKEGQPYSVRYEQVNAMLLNEFLKEHREVQELKRQIAVLTAGLQKVSVQLELNKPTRKTVLNNQ